MHGMRDIKTINIDTELKNYRSEHGNETITIRCK